MQFPAKMSLQLKKGSASSTGFSITERAHGEFVEQPSCLAGGTQRNRSLTARDVVLTPGQLASHIKDGNRSIGALQGLSPEPLRPVLWLGKGLRAGGGDRGAVVP